MRTSHPGVYSCNLVVHSNNSALSQLPRSHELLDDYIRQQYCDGVVVHPPNLVLTATFSVSLCSQIHQDLSNKLSFLFPLNKLVILGGQQSATRDQVKTKSKLLACANYGCSSRCQKLNSGHTRTLLGSCHIPVSFENVNTRTLCSISAQYSPFHQEQCTPIHQSQFHDINNHVYYSSKR